MCKFYTILFLNLFTITAFPYLVNANDLIYFRVLGFDDEIYGETTISIDQPTSIKKISSHGFSKLRIAADWNLKYQVFQFIKGKPWPWCYHIYSTTSSSANANLIYYRNQLFYLDVDRTLEGHSYLVSTNMLIEWLPCRDFKLDF